MDDYQVPEYFPHDWFSLVNTDARRLNVREIMTGMVLTGQTCWESLMERT